MADDANASLESLLQQQEQIAARVLAAEAAMQHRAESTPAPQRASSQLPSQPDETNDDDPSQLRRSPRVNTGFVRASHTNDRREPTAAAPLQQPRHRNSDINRRGSLSNTVQVDLFGRRTVAQEVPSAQLTAAGQSTASMPTQAAAGTSGCSRQQPELSAHERQRSVKQKAPEGPRGRSKAARTSKETSVSYEARLKENPNNSLTISGGKLFCMCCKYELPNLAHAIKKHVATAKHAANLLRFTSTETSDAALLNDLAEYFESTPDEKMASVRNEVHLLRYRIVETLLVSGTTFDRLKYFRPIFDRLNISLTDESHLKSYVPKIEVREHACVRAEVSDQFLSIAFDGTSRLGEAVNIVGRWVNSNFEIQERLLRFITTKLHQNAEGLAAIITRTICSELGVPPDLLVCLSRDSASVNGACCASLARSPFNISESIMCISHTLNNVGARIVFAQLNEFMTPWLELVGGSHPHSGAKDLWRKAVAPQVVPGFSNVRWHSKAEIQFVLAENFNSLLPFLHLLDAKKYGDATRQKLHSILDSREKSHTLKLQLAAMLDVRVLVRTTYELEGDRLELLLLYQRVEALRALGRQLRVDGAPGLLPNVDNVLRESVQLALGTKIRKAFAGLGVYEASIIAIDTVDSTLYPGKERVAYKVKYPSDGQFEHLEEEELRPLICTKELPERKEIVEGLSSAFVYLEARLLGTCDAQYDCSHMYQVSRAVRAFDPVFAAAHLTPQLVDELAVVRPFDEHISLSALKAELPAYLSVAQSESFGSDDVALYTENVLRFWRHSAGTMLPTWKRAARLVFSMSANSASCERVFSLLKAMFGDQQDGALADILQSALMLRYNCRIVHK